MTALCDRTARELAALLRRGETTAADILESTLERIQQVDGRRPATDPYRPAKEALAADRRKIHAYISIQADRARERAHQIDRMFAEGKEPGLLAGIPLAIKDIFCVKGMLSTAGSRMLESFVAPYTATPVERLEAAGALVLGKVNLDEYTFGSSNESSAFQPPPGNPWDPKRVAGGSSGGSAAAVAAGEAVLSLGSDTAGSIRQPAAFCGVVGLKPTYGRVSRYGLIAFSSSIDCPGPLARDVGDAALMLQVMAGADPRDATAAAVPVPDYQKAMEKDVCGMRIGLSPDYFRLRHPDPFTGELREQDISPSASEAVHRAAEVLARAGAEIVEDVPMPNTHHGIPAYFVISRVEAASNLHRFDGVKYGHRSREAAGDLRQLYRRSRAEAFGLQPKLRILMGMYVSSAQYEQQFYRRALQVRTLIRRDFEQVFDPGGNWRLDALLTATTPASAFPLGAVYGDSVLMQYADMLTVPANHAGVPAISLPAGLDKEGLPLGLQLIAPDFCEDTLFRVGRAFERASADAGWRSAKPGILAGLDGAV